MKFKALVFDLDGTALRVGGENFPSQPVIKAVFEAKKHVLVSVATGRRTANSKKILNVFDLVSPSIIMGGAAIIDPKTGEIIFQNVLDRKIIRQVADIAKEYPGEIFMGDGPILDRKKDFEISDCPIIYLRNPNTEIAEKIADRLKDIHGISYVYTPSWIKGWIDINVTDSKATKKHALEKLIGILGVKKEEVMVVGDSFNDFPLFEAGGFKVAMGNAEEALKAKADFIAPTVDEDGLAFVINKFILEENT